MHDSVYEIAGDDPRMAKLLRLSLNKLAGGPEGPLREMAEAVLRGELDLRRAAASTAYGDELGSAFDGALHRYDEMDPEERDALVRRTQEQLDQLLDEPSDRAGDH